MKRIIIFILTVIAFILLVAEPINDFTFEIILIKIISLLFIWLVSKVYGG